MTLPLTPLTPGTLVTAGAVAGSLSAAVSSAGTLTPKRVSVFNIMDYGGVGDGVHDDTAALQAVLNAAGQVGVAYLPQGTFYTGQVTWAGQSVLGSGIASTTVKGKAGTDVFVADTAASVASRQHAHISDFTLTVDDSSDVSGSLSRGGVGNAGFVFAFSDGSASVPLRWDFANVERLLVNSTSQTVGGKNNSCGFYLQIGANRSRFKDVAFYRLAYGWHDHYPTVNLSSVELANDHNHWDSLYFNNCGDSMRSVNNANCSFTNHIIHGGTNGMTFVGAASSNRTSCFVCDLHGVFIESVATNPWTIVGEGHTVTNLNISGTHGTIPWGAAYCVVNGAALKTVDNNPVLTISGNRNNFKGVYLANSPTTTPTITDNGTANTVGTVAGQKPTVTGSKGANAALTSLMTALAGLGIVIDSTT